MEDSETEDKVSVNPSSTMSGQPKMDTDTDTKVSSGNASNKSTNFNYNLPTSK